MVLFVAVVLFVFGCCAAHCSEGGISSYVPGFQDTLSGYLPPPGNYLVERLLFYTGYSGHPPPANNGKLLIGGQTGASLHLDLPVQFTIFHQVTRTRLLGSFYSWALVVPFAEPKLSGEIQTPSGSFFRSQSTAALAESQIVPFMLGWHNGRSHQKAWIVVYVPTGEFETDKLVFTSLGHWAVEFDYAYTFLDPKTGREFSAAPGYTFNTQNAETHYASGQEFHVDLAAVQRFPNQLGIGAVGYVFIQTTPDAGPGARLGPLEGRAYALGPIVTYNAKLGSVPIGLTGKYYGEFDVTHRFAGHSYWFNINAAF